MSDITPQAKTVTILSEFAKPENGSSEIVGKTSKPKRLSRRAWMYIFFATLAVFLTLRCPGTKLWVLDKSTNVLGLNSESFCELILSYAIVLLSFFAVQGSDPGYISKDMIEQNPSLEDEENQSVDCEGLELIGSFRYELGTEGQSDAINDVAINSEATGKDNYPSPLLDDSPAQFLDKLQRRQKIESRVCTEESNESHYQVRKLCQICGFHPPIRSHHCRVCNACVATFDHHCNFIDTCIGETNHCRFYLFLSCQLLGFMVCTNIVNSSNLHLNASNLFAKTPAWWVILAKAYLNPMALCATIMWISHTFFALCNITTFECGKGPRHIDYLSNTKACDFPFNQGVDSNLRIFCCWRDTAWQTLFGLSRRRWKPIKWQAPDKIVRDSENCWEHPCENKYYSCC